MANLDCALFSAVTPSRARGLRAWVIALVGLGCFAAAHAAPLADPTQPAPEWLAMRSPSPGGDAAGSGDVSGLRVLVIGPSRRFAIIDGKMIRQGDTYNGAKLVGIQPDGVVLQKDGSKEKLGMSPAVQKRVQQSKPVAGKDE